MDVVSTQTPWTQSGQTTCSLCDQPATRPVCQGCLTKWEFQLAETDALLDDLNVTLTRQARTAPRTGGRSTENPLPFHVGASEAATGLRLALKGVCNWVLEKHADEGRRIAPPFPAKSDRLAAFLLTHAGWVADQADGPDHIRTTKAAYRECRRVVDTAPNMITLGQCGATFAGVECTEPLRAPDTAAYVTCPVCTCEWDIEDRRHGMLEEAVDQHVTATEATRILDLEARRITDWVRRGHLTPTGTRDGRPLYVVAHVARLHRLASTGARLTNIDTEQEVA